MEMPDTWFDPDGLDTETLELSVALSLSIARGLGIPEMIDDACEFDKSQRKLTPGMASMAIMGTMFTCNLKDALWNVRVFYSGSPVDRLFGSRVDKAALNDMALGRAMDTIFDAGTEDLFCSIASRVKFCLGLSSPVYHVDPSNITICRSPGDEYEGVPEGAPIPKLGKPKDGREGRVQYNFVASTDGDGLPALMMPYDGNVDDTRMISEAVRKLESLMGDERIIAVGDSKLVTKDLVSHMARNGTLFVSKPQMSFDADVKHKVAREALEHGFMPIGKIGTKKDSPEVEAYETVRTSYGIRLRYIAYRRTDRRRIVRHMRRLDEKRIKDMATSMSHRSFESKQDAMDAHERAVKELGTNTFAANPTYRSRRSSSGGIEWKVSYKPVFDAEYAERLASEKVEVLVTNLPEGEDNPEDPRQGASTKGVLRIYFGQWHIEGLFGEFKSGMGADQVFLESPSREAVMLFLMSTAALVRSVIRLRLDREYGKGLGIPKRITAHRMYTLLQNVDVDFDRGSGRLRLTGSPEDRETAMRFMRALEVDPLTLI